jgi:ABC-2 type transport system ATP-binding protein
MNTLTAVDVSKRFGSVEAVRAVSMAVTGGTTLGLVGPNGAGKSTLIRVLAGLAKADRGTIEVDGVSERGAWNLGALPDPPPLFALLTGREQLAFAAAVGRRGMAAGTESAIAELAEALDLTSVLDRRIATYSRGTAKKVAFAATLITDPRVILLDEPFESVDPLGVRAMKQILAQFASVGSSLVVSSHLLPILEDVCSVFAVMSEGRLLFCGDWAALERRAANVQSAPENESTLESVLVELVAPVLKTVVLQKIAREVS